MTYYLQYLFALRGFRMVVDHFLVMADRNPDHKKNRRKSPKMLFLQLNYLPYAVNTLANITARNL